MWNHQILDNQRIGAFFPLKHFLCLEIGKSSILNKFVYFITAPL